MPAVCMSLDVLSCVIRVSLSRKGTAVCGIQIRRGVRTTSWPPRTGMDAMRSCLHMLFRTSRFQQYSNQSSRRHACACQWFTRWLWRGPLSTSLVSYQPRPPTHTPSFSTRVGRARLIHTEGIYYSLVYVSGIILRWWVCFRLASIHRDQRCCTRITCEMTPRQGRLNK